MKYLYRTSPRRYAARAKKKNLKTQILPVFAPARYNSAVHFLEDRNLLTPVGVWRCGSIRFDEIKSGFKAPPSWKVLGVLESRALGRPPASS